MPQAFGSHTPPSPNRLIVFYPPEARPAIPSPNATPERRPQIYHTSGRTALEDSGREIGDREHL